MNSISDSRLATILSAFTKAEWRHFKRFINSGVAGPIGKSSELYDYLSEIWPDFNHPGMRREAIFNTLYPDQKFDDKKIRYTLTDLYRQACSYLKYKGMEDNPDEGNHVLATTLARRNADKAYLALYQSDDYPSNIDADGSAERFFNTYRKEFVHLNYFTNRQKRNTRNPIADVARNLDIFFVAKKMQLLCEVINVRNVMSVQYDFVLQDKIIEMIQTGAFDDIPVVNIYYRILMTLNHPEEELHFETLKSLLLKHGSGFRKEELRDMYQYLMNYCIKKINLGMVKYVSILSGIYKTILENKVIYTGNYLSQWDFKNMVVIGIRAGEQDWVHQFIENYKSDLLQAEQNNAYVYNLAYYFFSTGNYKQTLMLLQQVEFTDLYYQLDMRAILLKCYFEMDDQETFFYHIAAFRIFLSRNKLVSEYQRVIYRNMIKYTTKLVRATGDHPKIKQILDEINEVKQIADINWLRKKVEVAMS